MLRKSSKKKDAGKDSEARAQALANLITKKKGEDVIIFDLRNLSPLTSYFVIATGLSTIHLKTIADHLREYERPDHIEGLEAATWVLLDFFDVVVHLFIKETREFYGLERLWGDAPEVKYECDS